MPPPLSGEFFFGDPLENIIFFFIFSKLSIDLRSFKIGVTANSFDLNPYFFN